MTIEEGNKIIAEFMGAEWVQDDYDDWGYKSDTFPSHFKLWSAPALKYHSSWDWLMPVVEKIENLDMYSVDIDKYKVNIRYVHLWNGKTISYKEIIEDSKIVILWYCIIKFINWYNNNK